MSNAVLDTHVHLWDVRGTPRQASTFVRLLGWNPPAMRWTARRLFPDDVVEFFGKPDHVLADHLPADLATEAEGRDLEGFVHIEANWNASGPMAAVDETRWLDSLDAPELVAIVGRVDLSAGSVVDDVLAAHLAASARFRGVRDPLASHPSTSIMDSTDRAGLMRDESWRRGIARLADYGLSFDATIYHHQLDDLAALAADVPQVPIILDHAGTPPAAAGPYGGLGTSNIERDRIVGEWRDGISQLAECEQVTVKVSGLAMPILGFGYHTWSEPPSVARVADDMQPFVDHLLDTFGAGRCMFGSNFPVDKAAIPWATLADATASVLADRPADERAAVLAGTGRRVYRI